MGHHSIVIDTGSRPRCRVPLRIQPGGSHFWITTFWNHSVDTECPESVFSTNVGFPVRVSMRKVWVLARSQGSTAKRPCVLYLFGDPPLSKKTTTIQNAQSHNINKLGACMHKAKDLLRPQHPDTEYKNTPRASRSDNARASRPQKVVGTWEHGVRW